MRYINPCYLLYLFTAVGMWRTAGPLRRRRGRLRHSAERLRVLVRSRPLPRHSHDATLGRRRPGRRQPEDADHPAARSARPLPLVRLHGQGLLPRPRRRRGSPMAVLRKLQDGATSRRRNVNNSHHHRHHHQGHL